MPLGMGGDDLGPLHVPNTAEKRGQMSHKYLD